MKNITVTTGPQNFRALKHGIVNWVLPPLALVAACLLAGCQSGYEDQPNPGASQPAAVQSAASQPAAVQSAAAQSAAIQSVAAQSAAVQPGQVSAKPAEAITLREGDVIKVSFPSSPNLDTVQPIRRDGKIRLELVGEVDAAGLTTAALEKKLVDLYAPQISSRQIAVEVESSSYPVYVTGMVQHPGKVLADHPITTLGAVMEAGGPDYEKANLKNITVIRIENGTTKNYKVNLRAVLDGKPGADDLFELKPDDIVYVPERFTIF
jgi:polysaccharide export outer membrane protein